MILHSVVDLSEGVVLRVPGFRELDFQGCELVFESESFGPHLVAEGHSYVEGSVFC